MDICPSNCLKLVPVEEIEGNELRKVALSRYGTEPSASRNPDKEVTATGISYD